MIGTGIGLLLLAVDGGIGRGEGVLLLGGLLAYTAWSVVEGRRSDRDTAAGPRPRPIASTRQGGGRPEGGG